jgi:hypothetical protein
LFGLHSPAKENVLDVMYTMMHEERQDGFRPNGVLGGSGNPQDFMNYVLHQPRRRSLGAEPFGRRGVGRPSVPLRVGPMSVSPSLGRRLGDGPPAASTGPGRRAGPTFDTAWRLSHLLELGTHRVGPAEFARWPSSLHENPCWSLKVGPKFRPSL